MKLYDVDFVNGIRKRNKKKERIVKNQRQIRSFRKYYKYNQEHGSCLKQDWLTRHLIFHFDALLRTLSLRNQTRIINIYYNPILHDLSFKTINKHKDFVIRSDIHKKIKIPSIWKILNTKDQRKEKKREIKLAKRRDFTSNVRMSSIHIPEREGIALKARIREGRPRYLWRRGSTRRRVHASNLFRIDE